MTTQNEDPAASSVAWARAAVVSVVALCGFQVWWGIRMRGEIADLRATAGRIEAAATAGAGGPAGEIAARMERLEADFAVLADDIGRMDRRIVDLTAMLEQRDGGGGADMSQPPDLDWTLPELFEAARVGADSVGISLTRDEVRVPAQIAQRGGPLEYFAVLKGGKAHESLLQVVGNTLPDQRRPKDMGIKLSNAIQALGFPRGQPIRFSAAGTRPAQGETIHLYVEWTTGGVKELVRAEDLVWHTGEQRPMKPGSWVFVGSVFVPAETRGELEFGADLTAELAATYSAPVTIIDNVETGAQDDTVFVAATPRIPADVENVTLVLRRTPASGVKEFPAPPPPGPPRGEDERK